MEEGMDTSKIAQEYRLAQWAQIIQDRIAEGKGVQEYCEEKGISKNTYFYWLRKVRKAACEQLAIRQDGTPTRGNQYSFTKVSMVHPGSINGINITESISFDYNGINVSIRDSYPPEKVAIIIRELARL